MIPSRGLRWSGQNLGIGRRRLDIIFTRSFSSTLNRNSAFTPISLTSKAGAFSRNGSLRPQILRKPCAIRNGVSIRFQSTSPTVSGTKDTIATSIDSTALAQNSSDLESFNNVIDLSSIDLHDIPERIGYLKEMGLDYGWGPTAMMEWIFEHVYILTGTPWWASIALTAIAVRVIMFYPYMKATDNSARMAIVAPLTKPLMDKMSAASRSGNNAETMKLRSEIQLINKRAGVKYWKAAIPLIQAPIGFGSFFLLRGMSKLPVPGFENGGLLWFSNIAIPDPYFLLPIATAGMLHLLLRKGGETGINTSSPGLIKGLSYFLPALTILFTWWLPAAVQLSFFVTGICGYLQAQLFRNTTFRQRFGITPMPKVPPKAAEGPAATLSPYQPRVKTPSVGSYEPPREVSKPTLLSGLTNEVKTSVEAVKTSAKKSLKSAKEMAGMEGPEGKRSRNQLMQAQEYEKKRRREEAKKRQQLDEERRARREVKRRERYER